VKVIVDAEVGSIATKAKEIKATWVILDRYYYTLTYYSIKAII
jgi:thymidylate kinase